MTGFCALTLTSASGAKFWLMPIARSSLPLIFAASYVSVSLRPAPSAMLPGSAVAGGPTRVTTPCSWSVAIISGMRAPDFVATRCRPLDSPAICGGLATLLDQAK